MKKHKLSSGLIRKLSPKSIIISAALIAAVGTGTALALSDNNQTPQMAANSTSTVTPVTTTSETTPSTSLTAPTADPEPTTPPAPAPTPAKSMYDLSFDYAKAQGESDPEAVCFRRIVQLRAFNQDSNTWNITEEAMHAKYTAVKKVATETNQTVCSMMNIATRNLQNGQNEVTYNGTSF